jgi:hypothetical protein
MGLFSKVAGMFSKGGGGRSLEDLCARLGVTSAELRAVRVEYSEFTIPKRDGSRRTIAAPSEGLKRVQRLILRRVLGRLPVHPSVVGFERGLSFVDHARAHAGRAVIVRFDIREFFPSTPEKRVREYLRAIGWGNEAGAELCRLCCRNGALPQGAPTSPRLANLVNGEMDHRLAGAAAKYGASYTRYADDLAFSCEIDVPEAVRTLITVVGLVLKECGYRVNRKKGPRVLRRHQRQTVTGLIVNDGPARLSRKTRRWLRAVEHRAASGSARGGAPSLSASQLAGWRALRLMVDAQGGRRTEGS